MESLDKHEEADVKYIKCGHCGDNFRPDGSGKCDGCGFNAPDVHYEVTADGYWIEPLPKPEEEQPKWLQTNGYLLGICAVIILMMGLVFITSPRDYQVELIEDCGSDANYCLAYSSFVTEVKDEGDVRIPIRITYLQNSYPNLQLNEVLNVMPDKKKKLWDHRMVTVMDKDGCSSLPCNVTVDHLGRSFVMRVVSDEEYEQLNSGDLVIVNVEYLSVSE